MDGFILNASTYLLHKSKKAVVPVLSWKYFLLLFIDFDKDSK